MAHQHRFAQSVRQGYEICLDCGTYHSVMLKAPKEIYEDNPYWGDGSGRSTLQQQLENLTSVEDCGISKINRVIQFIPQRGKMFLEIGCAPGILMDRMLDVNYIVYGIEPSIENIPFIVDRARGARILQGYFPEVTKDFPNDCFDCIVAMDVAEHIEDYEGFFREVHRLLIPNGRAIIMSPIILNKDRLIRDSEFIPEEHAWLWTEKFLDEYLKEIFSEVRFTRWQTSHEMIILNK